jgi:elongation factor P
MYSASDLRKGLKVEIDGQPYIITDFSFMKPGKGQAIYNCKLKNMINGTTLTRSYRSNDKLDRPELSEKTLQFSYTDGDHYVFMDQNYEQVLIPAEALGERGLFLQEDVDVTVLFHNNVPIDITLPTFLERRITQTEPGARGNTATNVLKPATVEGGYEIQVPLFVNEGDLIRIDTRTGEYADRVSKKG